MQSWKINQLIFDAIGKKNDILGIHIPNDKIKYINDNLIETIKKQFYDLEYIFLPAKSYCVALVYSIELSKDFKGSPIDYLKDPDLLLHDRYFVPYDKDPNTYDVFLENISWKDSPMAKKIKLYYNQEILLEGLEYDQYD